MSLEGMSSNINEGPSLKDTPEYQKKLDERTIQVEKEIEYSKQLTKVNDVLNVLDLPDEQEDSFRKTLEKQDSQTLKGLAKKQKGEIITFLVNENNKGLEEDKQEIKKETEKRGSKNEALNEQYKENDEKFKNIKNILPNGVYGGNSEFTSLVSNFDKFEDLKIGIDSKENEKTNIEKAKILDEIIAELKNPKVLKSAVELLGGADKNNPKYLKFKNTLIGIDRSFENSFYNLENPTLGIDSATNEVINSIQNDSKGLVSIDLNTNTPISKLSLLGSDYSFDKAIDKQAVSNLQESKTNKLTDIQNSYTILQDGYPSFDRFINEIRQNWGKQDLKEIIKSAISHFSKDIFYDFDEVYETMGIESSDQIKESDISSFTDVNSPNDLRLKIENIKNKFQRIKSKMGEVQAGIFKDYKIQMKELVEIEDEQKEKQKEILSFLKKSGFDLIPKSITNRIIRELQSNTLTIPGLNLNVKNIDLKNGNFGESGAFIDKEAGINISSKTNILKFMNKLISGNIDKPLSVKAIANGVSVADPALLKNKFLEADLVGGFGRKYGRIIENLKKVN